MNRKLKLILNSPNKILIMRIVDKYFYYLRITMYDEKDWKCPNLIKW